MNFKVHNQGAMIGAVSVSFLALIVGVSPIYGAYTYLGAHWPDLDSDSIPSRWAARIGALSSSYFLLADNPYPAALIGFFFMLAKVDKHRGWTHSIFLQVIIAGLGYKLGLLFEALAFSLGCYVHLFCDSKMIKKFIK